MCDLAIYITKYYCKAKEELGKLKYYFTMQKYNIIFTKKSTNRNQNPDIQIDLLPRGQNPLSYYALYIESKHNILALDRQDKTNKKLFPYERIALLENNWPLAFLEAQNSTLECAIQIV